MSKDKVKKPRLCFACGHWYPAGTKCPCGGKKWRP